MSLLTLRYVWFESTFASNDNSDNGTFDNKSMLKNVKFIEACILAPSKTKQNMGNFEDSTTETFNASIRPCMEGRSADDISFRLIGNEFP